MLKTKFANLARIAPALSLFSCAAPKAIIVETAPAPKQEAVAETTVPEPPVPTLADDGIRLPPMLDLPGEGEFRPTAPLPNKVPGETGAVISRPPTDPPPRPKPKPADAQ